MAGPVLVEDPPATAGAVSYARQRPRPGPRRPRGADLRAAIEIVRGRAKAGEPCYFWRIYPDCPGGWNWMVGPNHKHAFTAHHLDRVMDGGRVEVDAQRMAPAHRGCNARDGLIAQNARRRGLPTGMARETTSRTW